MKDQELPNRERFVRAVRNREIDGVNFIRRFAFIQGAFFVAFGCFFPVLSYLAAEDWKSVPLILALLSPLLIMPFVSVCGMFAELIFYETVCCPHCGKRFLKKISAAGNICPGCSLPLYRNEYFSHLNLPERQPDILQAYVFFLHLLMFGATMAIAVVVTHLQISYMQVTWIAIGILWMMIFPVWISVYRFYMRKFTKPSGEKICSVCDEAYSPLVLRMSGNCSVCGSQLDPDWPPPEPEPLAELPTRTELTAVINDKTEIPFSIFMIGYFIFSGIQFLLPQDHILRSIPGIVPWGGITLLILYFLYRNLYRGLWKKTKVLRKCPYCKFGSFTIEKKREVWNTGSAIPQYTRYFLRCPKCRRKLFRDNDTEKGGTIMSCESGFTEL